jgi:hypothetical protein
LYALSQSKPLRNPFQDVLRRSACKEEDHFQRLVAVGLVVGTDRTAFIHGYRQWRTDPLRLVEVLEFVAASPDANTVLGDFRSVLCAAFALVDWQTLATTDQEALRKTMRQLYSGAPNGGTRSAAACALTHWGQPLPEPSASARFFGVALGQPLRIKKPALSLSIA